MKTASIDEFIDVFPKEARAALKAIRRIIKECAPKAEEKFGYGVPGFYFQGPLVYYSAFKNHIGFYPASSGIKVFKKELQGYKTSPGTIQFPLGEPLPIGLIKKIVKFRVKENTAKAAKKH